MNKTLEYRGSKIRVEDAEKHIYAARIVNYGPVDSHGTSWAPGVFTESLQRKMPKSVWSHDPTRPIGKVIEYRDSEEGLDVLVQFADLNAVPDARMAYSLLDDEIIDEFSFAFYRKASEPDPNNPGAIRITRADITEVSPVLTASGQGTGTLGVRSAGTITRAEADDLLRQVTEGKLDAQAALAELASRREAPKVEIRCATKEAADVASNLLSGQGIGFTQSAENGRYLLEATLTEVRQEAPAFEVRAQSEEIADAISAALTAGNIRYEMCSRDGVWYLTASLYRPSPSEPRAATEAEIAEEAAELRALDSLLAEEF